VTRPDHLPIFGVALTGVREVVYSRSFPTGLTVARLRVVTSKSGAYAAILGASATAVEHYSADGLGDRGADGRPGTYVQPAEGAAQASS
jgi:hypothetical protein